MLGQTSEVSSTHQNKKRRLYKYMSANSVRGRAQQHVDP
jgi:hypothetical protein